MPPSRSVAADTVAAAWYSYWLSTRWSTIATETHSEELRSRRGRLEPARSSPTAKRHRWPTDDEAYDEPNTSGAAPCVPDER